MLEPITFKFLIDIDGLLGGVEIWQGDQHITVSMSAALHSTNTGYRWSEIKDFMDKVQLPKKEK